MCCYRYFKENELWTKANKYEYIIKVSYNNQQYELLNTYNSNIYKYSERSTITAYLSNN